MTCITAINLCIFKCQIVYLKITSGRQKPMMKFGQLILKIIKSVATGCQVLRLICTKIDLQRSPQPLAGMKGTYF